MIPFALVGFYKVIYLESHEKCRLWGIPWPGAQLSTLGQSAEMGMFPSVYSGLFAD